MFLEKVRHSFAGRVVAYLKTNHRDHIQAMSNEELEALIRRQITAAESYGITMEVAVVQFIETGLAYGEKFHSSGQHPEAERILQQNVDAGVKMQQLQESAKRGFQPV